MSNDRPWYQNSEMIVAMSALIIGLVTASTSIYSASVDRAYARASVWPRLEILTSFTGESFYYSIANQGTGPAIIKQARVTYTGQPIQRWSEVPAYNHFVQSHMGRRILSPQEKLLPLLYEGTNAAAFQSERKNIDIELCYCSIYEECWQISLSNGAVPVAQCTIEQDELFLQ